MTNLIPISTRFIAQTFLNSCQINVFSSTTTDTYGEPTNVYTAGSSIPCGYNPGNGTKKFYNGNEVIEYFVNPTFRLPIGTNIKDSDHILCNSDEFAINSITIGKTCITVACTKVTV